MSRDTGRGGAKPEGPYPNQKCVFFSWVGPDVVGVTL